MPSNASERVMQSYGRCSVQPAFFDEFYSRFMASSPEVKTLFQNTDFKRQNTLLRVGLSYLIIYGDGSESVKGKIEELGTLHGRSKLNIRPELYPLWVDSLMEAVRQYDVRYTEELGQAWRETLQKGIRLMLSKY